MFDSYDVGLFKTQTRGFEKIQDGPQCVKRCTKTILNCRQSLLSLHMTKSYVRTATRSTLKVEANLTQILNFKANFHTEFEPFFKKKIYANNGGHFKIVSMKIKN